METCCPDCRSHALRRRRRSGFSLYLVSLLGQWPYRCEECGTNFLLRKRYLKSKSETKHSESSSRHLRGVVLTAPVGGVASGDAINLKHSAAVRDVNSLSSNTGDPVAGSSHLVSSSTISREASAINK